MNTKIKALYIVLYISVLLVVGVLIFLLSGKSNFFSSNQIFSSINSGLLYSTGRNSSTSSSLSNLFNNNSFEEANELVDQQLSENPDNVDLLLQKAQILIQEASLNFKEKELGDQARAYITKALGIDPQNPKALAMLGYTYEIQQEYTKAIGYYNQSIDLVPDYAYPISQKGHALHLQGKIDEADINYLSAIKIDPENPTALLGHAKILVSKGQVKEAKQIFLDAAKVIKDKRHLAEIYYSLFVISQGEGVENVEDMEKYANLSVANDPTYPQAHVAMATAIFLKEMNNLPKSPDPKNIKESFEQISRALNIYKNLSTAHLQLAIQLISLKQTDHVKSVLSDLPDIIKNDITLNTIEKSQLSGVVSKMKNNLK